MAVLGESTGLAPVGSGLRRQSNHPRVKPGGFPTACLSPHPSPHLKILFILSKMAALTSPPPSILHSSILILNSPPRRLPLSFPEFLSSNSFSPPVQFLRPSPFRNFRNFRSLPVPIEY